jgi:hypothetical protein
MAACIPSNPDISGIGVRAAIYVQNILAFAPVVTSLWDKRVDRDELEPVKDSSVGTLTIAFAVLISTFIQGMTLDLSNLHTAIVLDLSWMNNTSTFIWFLLYVNHRSTSGSDCQVRPTWSDWSKAIVYPLYRNIQYQLQLRDHEDSTDGQKYNPAKLEQNEHAITQDGVNETRGNPNARTSVLRRLWNSILEDLVLVLGSIHLSAMAGIGLWLWRNPTAFGTGLDTACSAPPTLSIIGQEVSLYSRGLQVISLMLYSALLVPGFNFAIPFLFFLGSHILYNKYRNWSPKNGRGRSHGNTHPDPKVHTEMVYVGLVLLFAINVAFIVDIELTLSDNRHLQASGEEQWGFGQVLPLLLLIVPIRDFVSSLTRIQKDKDEKASSAQKQLNLEYIASWTVDTRLDIRESFLFRKLIRDGANPNIPGF